MCFTQQLNQTTEDWHTGCVTLSGAKGLVCRRDASPTAQHDSRPWSSQVYQCRVVRFSTMAPFAHHQKLAKSPKHRSSWSGPSHMVFVVQRRPIRVCSRAQKRPLLRRSRFWARLMRQP